MTLWILLIVGIYKGEIRDFLRSFEASLRAQQYDTARFYYEKVRTWANSNGGYLGDYINALAIFKMITSNPNFVGDGMLDSAIFYAERSINAKNDFSDSYALLGALYGLKIAKNVTKAISLGRKSEEAFEKAKELDPKNPRVYYLYGTGLLFRPKSFGGSKERAIQNFLNALNLYENEDDNSLSWGYLECKALLGYAYEEMGQFDSAQVIYKEILKQDPGFKWVRERLGSVIKRRGS